MILPSLNGVMAGCKSRDVYEGSRGCCTCTLPPTHTTSGTHRPAAHTHLPFVYTLSTHTYALYYLAYTFFTLIYNIHLYIHAPLCCLGLANYTNSMICATLLSGGKYLVGITLFVPHFLVEVNIWWAYHDYKVTLTWRI